MSTFAVWGMTLAEALKDARKNTPTTKGKGESIAQMTPAEWEKACQAKAEKVMKGAKTKQLSTLFDAPQFAEQFIKLMRKDGECRDLHIRYRSTLKDAHGKPLINKKTGKNKVGWTAYDKAA